MPRNTPNSPERLAALHDSHGLTEAFADLWAVMPEGWWFDELRIVTDTYNAIYDANPRWRATACGIEDPVGGDEEAEGATIVEAIRGLIAKLRDYEPLYPAFAPGIVDAMDALYGANDAGITKPEAVAILNERSPGWGVGGWPTHVQEVKLTPDGPVLGERREVE